MGSATIPAILLAQVQTMGGTGGGKGTGSYGTGSFPFGFAARIQGSGHAKHQSTTELASACVCVAACYARFVALS